MTHSLVFALDANALLVAPVNAAEVINNAVKFVRIMGTVFDKFFNLARINVRVHALDPINVRLFCFSVKENKLCAKASKSWQKKAS